MNRRVTICVSPKTSFRYRLHFEIQSSAEDSWVETHVADYQLNGIAMAIHDWIQNGVF